MVDMHPAGEKLKGDATVNNTKSRRESLAWEGAMMRFIMTCVGVSNVPPVQ